jgi:chaperonin GroEL
MKKQIITGDEAKEQLLEGAELLYKAVSTTLGPKGQNAVIEAYGEPIVTHDGVTVAKSIDNIKNASPGARVGIEMIKASSSRTNDNVGDGTTSSTILAYALMSKGMEIIKAGKNAMVLRRELESAKDEALKELDKLAEPVTTEKAAIEIATISSEDNEIGKQVGHMFHVLGKDGLVAVEIGTKPETEYEIVEGYTFERGFISPLMVSDVRTQSTTLLNPAVIITEKTVGFRDLAVTLEELYQDGKDGVIVICNDFKSDLVDRAILSKQQDFEIIGVKAPGFGVERPKLLNDIAKICSTEVTKDFATPKIGTCGKIVVTHNETVITEGADVSEHIKDLEAEMDRTTGQHDKDKIEKRIAQLHAKVGQIRVGGNTEMEAEERKYLIDDAVAATEAALKDGIVPGGGTTYISLATRLEGSSEGHKLLRQALLEPFKVLMTNAGERSGLKIKELEGLEFGSGFDVMGDGSVVNLKEHGIIDPVLVIKQAIINSTSVASSALTTGVLITFDKDDKDEEE